jgi:hypothetical protein
VALDCDRLVSPHFTSYNPHIESTAMVAVRIILTTIWTDRRLLSSMGGPQDRTYSIHPHHTRVSLPKNINDVDLPLCESTPPQPADSVTDMSYFLARIYLAKACRHFTDILTVDSNDVDALRFDQVLYIDQMFNEVYSHFPSGYALDAPLPANAPPYIRIQRQVIHLALAARRARFFRAFVQPREDDIRLKRFRAACLSSAQEAIQIAINFLTEAFDLSDGPIPGSPSSYRLGHATSRQSLPRQSDIVIYHFFQACIALAGDPCLAAADRNAAAEARRQTLLKASKTLERVGRQSILAAGLVSKLVGVLRRRRVCDVDNDDANPEDMATTETQAHRGNYLVTSTSQEEAVPRVNTSTTSIDPYQQMGALTMPPLGQSWQPVPTDQLTSDSIWMDFMECAPNMDTWDQAYTDLDYMTGLV